MIFYLFNSDFELMKELDSAGFSGVLFTYNAASSDYFIKIGKNIDLQNNLKYMVAIRPYTISPQYLCKINQSIQEISRDRLQINFISGHIKDSEKDFGGIVGNVNDISSSVSRSNYLIEYLDVLEKTNTEIPDYYVSVSNNFTFEAAVKHKSKMIIAYSQYKNKIYDLSNKKVMIAVTPILRKTQKEIDSLSENTVRHRIDMESFTYNEFFDFINKLKSENIKEIILSAWNLEETQNIIDFVKEYKESNK